MVTSVLDCLNFLLVLNDSTVDAEMRFYFDGERLPTLLERMKSDGRFQGLAGNLGYYVTAELIEGKPWSHNARYPGFPLPKMPSYLASPLTAWNKSHN